MSVRKKVEIKIGEFSVEKRNGTGKSVTRKLRAKGFAPGTIYGEKSEPLNVSFDPLWLKKALDPQKKRNTLLDVTVKDGNSSTETLHALLKDIQIDPVTWHVLHADFLRVLPEKPVRVHVPLVLEGKPEGVKLGGVLHQVFRTVEVECAANKIPPAITADVSDLKEEETLSAGNIKPPEGVKLCLAPTRTCALVMASRASRATGTDEGEAAPAAAK